ncbi:hypothetical protein MATL_G00101280 [Megalops atlanticus]|uniref:Uncharacterized protein n=1 Tax=Megalops atlanticus TaxID=7932 RepID=A0A9D3Q4H3_MEGAT|nr:hypothetical protein MATL_G00101280 [Megalops atlanticus]
MQKDNRCDVTIVDTCPTSVKANISCCLQYDLAVTSAVLRAVSHTEKPRFIHVKQNWDHSVAMASEAP